MINNNRVPNNDSEVEQRILNLNMEGVIDVFSDDGNVGVRVRNENLHEIVGVLQNLNLPRVGDGVQEGSVWVSNEDRSVSQELSDFDL